MPFAFLEGPDLIIVLLIVVLLFGGAKLPGLARSLGQAQREFHNATRGEEPSTTPPSEETITMTKAELDRLLEERAARPQSPPASGPGDATPN